MRFSVFWPCYGTASICGHSILAEGIIERDTDRKFAAFLADVAFSSENEPHLNKLSPYQTVCFNSPGGDIAGSIKLGRQIRELGFDTCLEPEYSRVIPGTLGEQEVFARDVVCASACAFAFAGGVNRSIRNGSRYGIHQFYGETGDIGDSATQLTVVALAAYLEKMGINRGLLDAASLVPSQAIYWLSPTDLSELRVDNMTVVNSQWRLDALKDGAVVANIVQINPEYRSRVSLTVMKRSNHPLLIVTFTAGERYPGSPEEVSAALNGEGVVTLHVDGQQVATYTAVHWEPAKRAVVAVLPLSDLTIRALESGKVLDVQAWVARAVRQYDPSLEFPLDGIAHLLKAVLR